MYPHPLSKFFLTDIEGLAGLRQYLLCLPEGALSQPIMLAGERLTAYQVIKEIVLGCVGHLGEIEALKALQIRAKMNAKTCTSGSREAD